jgi:hypothetical protein
MPSRATLQKLAAALDRDIRVDFGKRSSVEEE